MRWRDIPPPPKRSDAEPAKCTSRSPATPAMRRSRRNRSRRDLTTVHTDAAAQARTLRTLESAMEARRDAAPRRRGRARAQAARLEQEVLDRINAAARRRNSVPRRSACTATITSARCCGPRAISTSSTSKASRPGRSPSGARSSPRSRMSRACCARSATRRYAGLFAHLSTRPGRSPRSSRGHASGSRRRARHSSRVISATAGALFLPAEPAQRDALLQLFMLDKALYELNYELNNSPDWVRIPLAAILDVIGSK